MKHNISIPFLALAFLTMVFSVGVLVINLPIIGGFSSFDRASAQPAQKAVRPEEMRIEELKREAETDLDAAQVPALVKDTTEESIETAGLRIMGKALYSLFVKPFLALFAAVFWGAK